MGDNFAEEHAACRIPVSWCDVGAIITCSACKMTSAVGRESGAHTPDGGSNLLGALHAQPHMAVGITHDNERLHISSLHQLASMACRHHPEETAVVKAMPAAPTMILQTSGH